MKLTHKVYCITEKTIYARVLSEEMFTVDTVTEQSVVLFTADANEDTVYERCR